jgi:hypothetical protein
VKDVKLVRGQDSATHKGSGFVKMMTSEAADKAVGISDMYWQEKLRMMDKAEA